MISCTDESVFNVLCSVCDALAGARVQSLLVRGRASTVVRRAWLGDVRERAELGSAPHRMCTLSVFQCAVCRSIPCRSGLSSSGLPEVL